MAAKKKAGKKRAAKKTAAKKPSASPEFKTERYWLNKSAMAESLGISVQAFDKWGVKPVSQRHQFGEAFYTVRDVLDNRLEWQRRKLENPGQNLDATELILEKERAELALTQARAEGQRLKNSAMKRELAPVAMVQWAISQAGSQIAAVLGTLKGRLKRTQPNLTNTALHEIEQLAVEVQNVAADVRLDWNDFDIADLSDPRSD